MVEEELILKGSDLYHQCARWTLAPRMPMARSQWELLYSLFDIESLE